MVLACHCRETGRWPLQGLELRTEDGTEFNGGHWCTEQRMCRNGTAPEGHVITRAEVAILDEEGFVRDTYEAAWQERFQELEDFVAEHGVCMWICNGAARSQNHSRSSSSSRQEL